MRLLIFLSSTHVGGAERMTINLANQVAGQTSTRLVVGRAGALNGEIDAAVDLVDLGVARMREAVRPLRCLIRDWAPAVAFAPKPDASVALAIAWRMAGRPGALVLRESNHRSAQARYSFWNPVIRGMGWAYRQAGAAVAPAQIIATDLATRHRLPPDRIHVIHNPVDIVRLRQVADDQAGHSRSVPHDSAQALPIVAVGRLVPQKGFDLLLRALAAARTDAAVRGTTLTILGEGPERPRLESLISELGLEDAVCLPGVAPNPYAVMARAALFVLSSRWEGFPNSLVEAMALGVPPVAYNCPGGAGEIIDHARSGLLCAPESVSDLSAAMVRVAGDAELRSRLAAGAAARAGAFDAPTMSRQYLQLFESLAGQSAGSP